MYNVESAKNHEKVRNTFLSILNSMGGVMTFEQAKKTLYLLDEKRNSYETYRASRYLYTDFHSGYLKEDHENCLIHLNSKGIFAFNKDIILSYSLILDFVEAPSDLASIDVSTMFSNSIEFIFGGERYMIIPVNVLTVGTAVQTIYNKETAVKETMIDSDLIRPKYMFLINEKTVLAINDVMDKLDAAQIGYPHKYVAMTGNIDGNAPGFEYYGEF